MTIKKRDGRIVNFDDTKIVNAIKKASEATETEKLTETDISKVMDYVKLSLENLKSSEKPIEVKEIHTVVENSLMAGEFFNVARSYIEYRSARDRKRFGSSKEISFYREKLDAKRNDRQNANVDEESFGGRTNEAASSLNKEIALNYYISPKYANNHRDNISYIHDLSEWCIGEHNCLSFPIDQCLEKGFTVKNSDCRPAGSISSAEQLIQVLLQTQSLNQFGGVSCTHLDFSLEPYVRKSFMKNFIKASIKDSKNFKTKNLIKMIFEDYVDDFGIVRNSFEEWLESNKAQFFKNWGVTFDDFFIGNKKLQKISKKWYKSALLDTIIETNQAAEGLYHNLNTLLSRSGDQLPFSSINFGKNTSFEGKLLNESFYRASILGIGKYGRTSIFPCQIFQYDKEINGKEGSPNYDFYIKFLNSTVRRLYPNYANSNWSVQINGIEKDRDLKKKVIQSLNKDDYKALVEIFKKKPNLAAKINIEVINDELVVTKKVQPTEDFSTMGALHEKEHLYVKIDNMIFNMSIKELYDYCKNKTLSQLPIAVFSGLKNFEKSHYNLNPGVFSITYTPEDVTYIGSCEDLRTFFNDCKKSIIKSGKVDSYIDFNDHDLNNYEFKVLKYTDDLYSEEHKYVEFLSSSIDFGTENKEFKMLDVSNKKIYIRPIFGHDSSVPQDIIYLSDKDIKVLDIHKRWIKVKHIFKNDKLNTPLMMHIWYTDSKNRYCLSCTEDHPLWTGKGFTKAYDLKIGDNIYDLNGTPLKIYDIRWHDEPVDSYDIGTESGSFIGSDIIMHNCRTNNGYDANFTEEYFLDLLMKIKETEDIPDNYLYSAMQRDGRGNIAPQTLILPTIAMMAKNKFKSTKDSDSVIEEFMTLLDKYIDETKDSLIERFEWIASQNPNSAKFMYSNNTMKGYNPEEGIRSALKHGTLAIGQLGLAECLQILIGCDHTEEKGMKLALRIESFFKKKCDSYKEEIHYVEPKSEDIIKEMKDSLEKKYKRPLYIKEISEIETYVKSVHKPK